jgi:hypothetical protein
MDTSSLHPSVGNDDPSAQPSPGNVASMPTEMADLADLADQACCCPAQAMVRVMMPPTATRPVETGLMMCGHHYRAARRALAAAHATVCELPWTPRDTAEWIHDDPDHSLEPVS